jgi:hypothetical protein
MKQNLLVEIAEKRITRRMRIPLAVRFGLMKKKADCLRKLG